MPRSHINILLVEPQPLVRSTVAAVAREMKLAHIDDTSSIEAAAQRLSLGRYDGVLLSLEEHQRALALLAQLRAGELATSAEVPVVVLTGPCGPELVTQMKEMQVSRLLIKPFKVKTVLETIDALAARAVQLHHAMA